LDVLVLLAAYLVASLLHKGVTALLRARDTYAQIEDERVATICADPACPFRRFNHHHVRFQAGDGAAPDSQDEGSADTSRAVCNDPAASSPLHQTPDGFHPMEPGCCKYNPTPLGSYEIRLPLHKAGDDDAEP
jgi:hypothetical protein